MAFLSISSQFAHADAINVNLGDDPGFALSGPAGGKGKVWNSWKPVIGTMLDSEGNPTTLQIITDGEGPYGDWWCDMPLLSGGIAARDQEEKQMRISGLDTNSAYDLYLACARGDREANTLFVPAIPNSAHPSRQADNRTARNGSIWVDGQNFVLFQDMIPDDSGTVALAFEGVGTYGILNGLQIVAVGESVKTYGQWASEPSQALSPGPNDGPLDDADKDGIDNLLEFVLNGNPLVPSSARQPKLLQAGNGWIYEYDRRDASRYPSSEQAIEYSNDLIRWTPLLVPPVSSGNVEIIDHGLFDRVQVRIPSPTGNLFVRLRVRSLTPTASPAQVSGADPGGETDQP